MDTVLPFYETMAESYHLIFRDWEASMRRQGSILAALLPSPEDAGWVLDCACGIGTQCLPLAERGYRMEASDLSPAEVARARREAAVRGLCIDVRVDDMRRLGQAPSGRYGAVLCLDNALPHLDSDADMLAALSAMRDRLRPGGTLLLSQRDYGPLLRERPACQPPSFFDDASGRRIVFQVWDWCDERRYTVHIFVSRQCGEGWQDIHFVGRYRAISCEETAALARQAGLANIRILAPADTGFHQPIIAAVRP